MCPVDAPIAGIEQLLATSVVDRFVVKGEVGRKLEDQSTIRFDLTHACPHEFAAADVCDATRLGATGEIGG